MENNNDNQQPMSLEERSKLINQSIKYMQQEAKFWELNAKIEKAKFETMFYKIKYFELTGQQKNDEEQKNNDMNVKDKQQ